MADSQIPDSNGGHIPGWRYVVYVDDVRVPGQYHTLREAIDSQGGCVNEVGHWRFASESDIFEVRLVRAYWFAVLGMPVVWALWIWDRMRRR